MTDIRATIAFVSLGCPKNLVDTERMMDQAARYGAVLSGDHHHSDIVVINTCGFLEPAKDESLATIGEFVESKRRGQIKGLVVAGCMTERYLSLMEEKFPEVDGFLQTKDFSQLPVVMKEILEKDSPALERRRRLVGDAPSLQGFSELPDYTPRSPGKRSFAYVKISEGCNRTCSFCIIPKLRGKHHSRSIEGIVHELNDLVAADTREIIFIAQDLTSYGLDRGDGTNLLALLKAVEAIKGLRWYRLMYNYPRFFSDELIAHLASSKKFSGYIDMPFQHISDTILKKMRRPESSTEIRRLIGKLKEEIPGVSLRTTLMVGFPGETEADFAALEKFVEEVAFDHLGVFTYYREEGTPSFEMPDQISEETKQARYQKIMNIQKRQSRIRLAGLVGKSLDVAIDTLHEKNTKTLVYRGRHCGQAPDIDGVTYVTSEEPLEIGSSVQVRVNKVVGDYDLLAVRREQSKNEGGDFGA